MTKFRSIISAMSRPLIILMNPAGSLCLLIAASFFVPPRAPAGAIITKLQETAPQETPKERTERMKKPLVFAPQRMVVEAPHEDVPLGNPVELTVTLAPGKIIAFGVLQRDHTGPLAQADGEFKVLRTEASTKTIEIVPMQIGSLDVEIGAVYSDNAYVRQVAHLHVIPCSKRLRGFWINGRARTMSLVFDDSEYDHSLLQPGVEYEGIKFPIGLGDCADFKLSVIPIDEVSPAVTTDKFCVVRAIHPGKAYVVGDFDGVKDRVLVTVYDKDNAPYAYQELRDKTRR